MLMKKLIIVKRVLVKMKVLLQKLTEVYLE